MKKKTLITLVLVVAGIAFGHKPLIGLVVGEEETRFGQAEVIRGDLENLVSSTGTVEAMGTVEIGTEVSGTIASVDVDYNDLVRVGDLLAVLDTDLLAASFTQAEANVERAEAQLELAKTDHERNESLAEKGYLKEAELLSSRSLQATRAAELKSARAELQRTGSNLEAAYIRSPIDGTVIERTVEAGQTVAASLSAPILFTIAEDLSRVEVHASVDESDIGQVQEGMTARFTVPAYPDAEFEGQVDQIRLHPSTIQNVVNYTVIVRAENPDGQLLPGMTATIDFVIEERQDALLVPNAALRFQPTGELIEKARGMMTAPRGPVGKPLSDEANQSISRIWYLDSNGEPAVSRVETGMTDGRYTEILGSSTLGEGTSVITTATSSASRESDGKQADSFRPGPGGGGGGGRRGFF